MTAPRPIPLTFHSLHMSPSLLVLLYRCHLRTLFSGSSDPTQMPFPAGAIKRSDEFTAEDCIVGGYSIEEQLPDQDLGRSVRPGFRNFTKDPNRVFGLPSIRRDIPSKHTVWFSMLLLNGSCATHPCFLPPPPPPPPSVQRKLLFPLLMIRTMAMAHLLLCCSAPQPLRSWALMTMTLWSPAISVKSATFLSELDIPWTTANSARFGGG